MLNEKIAALCNKQVNEEFYSAYLYLDIADYYDSVGLDGFCNWYTIQAQEESDHAMLFLQYMRNNDAKVTLEAIAKPEATYANYRSGIELGRKHEGIVTDLIHNIYEAAHDLKDYRTMQFLDWFVKEQNEEEKNADDLLKKYDLYGTDAKGLYALNNELSSRTYSAPSLQL